MIDCPDGGSQADQGTAAPTDQGTGTMIYQGIVTVTERLEGLSSMLMGGSLPGFREGSSSPASRSRDTDTALEAAAQFAGWQSPS